MGALYSPDAGNVIPYEFAIALAENAVDNGVEKRLRRCVTSISEVKVGKGDDGDVRDEKEDEEEWFEIEADHWEPREYVESRKAMKEKKKKKKKTAGPVKTTMASLAGISTLIAIGMGLYMLIDPEVDDAAKEMTFYTVLALTASELMVAYQFFGKNSLSFFSSVMSSSLSNVPFDELV